MWGRVRGRTAARAGSRVSGHRAVVRLRRGPRGGRRGNLAAAPPGVSEIPARPSASRAATGGHAGASVDGGAQGAAAITRPDQRTGAARLVRRRCVCGREGGGAREGRREGGRERTGVRRPAGVSQNYLSSGCECVREGGGRGGGGGRARERGKERPQPPTGQCV